MKTAVRVAASCTSPYISTVYTLPSSAATSVEPICSGPTGPSSDCAWSVPCQMGSTGYDMLYNPMPAAPPANRLYVPAVQPGSAHTRRVCGPMLPFGTYGRLVADAVKRTGAVKVERLKVALGATMPTYMDVKGVEAKERTLLTDADS